MSEQYRLIHLRGAGNDTGALTQAIAERRERWHSDGVQVWGLWRGLFGLASNEALLMLAAADVENLQPTVDGQIQVLSSRDFTPTVRPQTSTPVSRPGIYVFRSFTIASASEAEFVELSTQAWVTFEDAPSYSAEPQGLFREDSDAEQIDMLLVTWYDSLASWQTSRQPAGEARERFARRRELTRSTVALATTLID